jgi:peptidoglycan/LPS O-acetylase OafA/YrhL
MSSPRRANNFDLLRLGAAALVVFHHCFSVTGSREPLHSINAGDTFGNLGVLFFFSISGYLVTQSWSRTRRVVPFGLKRALRLLPALVVSVTLVALVLGTAVTVLPTVTYLTSQQTYRYIVDNSLLHTVYTLPGVFAHVPYTRVVNASLWTIPIEAHAYIAVALLGVIGLWRRSSAWLALAAGLLLLNVSAAGAHLPLGDHLLTLVGGAATDARYLAAFCIGAALFVQRERVALRWDLFWAGVVAYLVSLLASPTVHQSVAILVVPYLTVVLAYRTSSALRVPPRLGDLSYGVYVYGFPVQQLLSEHLIRDPWVMFVAAMPLVAGLAFASWHLVEAPALRLKPDGSRRRDRTAAPWSRERSARVRAEVSPGTEALRLPPR